MNIVHIPDGPWDDHLADIEQCQYEDIEGTPMWEESLESRIDHPEKHVGDGDVWFRCGDKGFGGLWEPSNRRALLRFAPVFVAEAARGEGIGRALVVKRFRHALDRPDIEQMDTYAHNPGFFEELGFEVENHWPDKGTYYLSYTKS